ncbi:MAG: NAD(P)/FAD-dependent oxidoreductase [Granulosicoccaceae bacterium]
MKLSRRRFAQLIGAATATIAVPYSIRAQSKPSVVVVGGGAGGATAARLIAKDADGAIDVTLVQDTPEYTSCFFSNLYLGGFRDFKSITHSYANLINDYGINLKVGLATEVDRAARTVMLADGTSVGYDRLVIAPGIDFKFDSVPGYTEDDVEIAPHAWKAGAQTKILKDKLDALEDGQNIIMVPPPNPYRCPPGPYERVSMMAHLLKSKGFTNSTITILDVKPKFSKQGLFQAGWEKYYPGMVEWIAPDVHGGIIKVDAKAGTVETDLDTFEGALLNIIPGQTAGAIAHAAGLTDDTGFCPVEATSMRSTVDANIFVVGDACIAGDMPKSGFSANSQGKVAAMNVRGDLLESKVFPAKFSNTCWSLIATKDGVKVGAQYAPKDGKITAIGESKFLSKGDETAEDRMMTAVEADGWYSAMTSSMFK